VGSHLSSLPNLTHEALDSLKKLLLELIKGGFLIDKIYIYGDYVRGEVTSESNLDVVIISNNFETIEFNERISKIHKICMKNCLHPWIEPIPLTPNEFNDLVDKWDALIEASKHWIKVDDISIILREKPSSQTV